jgi:hypothetical protein
MVKGQDHAAAFKFLVWSLLGLVSKLVNGAGTLPSTLAKYGSRTLCGTFSIRAEFEERRLKQDGKIESGI